MKKIFITGTDTDAGKTYATVLLAEFIKSQGHTVACLKPVAAGAELIGEQWQNDDAKQLLKASNALLTYEQVNPICFPEPIAPHIAADIHQHKMTVNSIRDKVIPRTLKADICLIEGAGGWMVPLNLQETFAELACSVADQVIVVVGMKLGCINHALLTVQAIEDSPISLAGWIANQVDEDMDVYQENVHTLKSMIRAPLLGEIRHNASAISHDKSLYSIVG